MDPKTGTERSMSEIEPPVARDRVGDGRAARLAGALILLGYVTYGIPQVTHTGPLLDASDPLAAVAANSTRLTIGALVMAINSAAVVGIGVLLYPVLKRHDELIALGYVLTRVFEGIVLIGGIVGLLSLVPLSQEYVQASSADPASMQAISEVVVHGNSLAYHVAMIGLAIGSLPFCYLLYRSNLVPRSIPLLGLIGYPALLLLMVIDIFGIGFGSILYVLYLPGAVFEIGLALWLVARGFDTAERVSMDPATAVTEPAE